MSQLRWTDPNWLDSARQWFTAQLETHGYQVTPGGEIAQPHIRPWSTAMSIPTKSGLVWFKAGTDALAHEAALTPFLAGLLPEHSPQVIAAERERGWLLMEDLGEQLRARINSIADLHWWHRTLPIYATLQQRAAARFDELLATGVTDNRMSGLKHQWDDLLADTDRLMVGIEGGLSERQYAVALSLWPRIEELVTTMNEAGLPATVVHEDLHDANVFMDGDRIIVADWGDSSISSPLATLTVLLRSAAYRRDLEVEAPAIAAIRDSYLACWGEYASPSVLNASADAAIRIGMLHRSMTWRKSIMSAPAEHTEEYREAVPGWLEEFLGTFGG